MPAVLAEPIAQGRTSEVYAWGTGCVLKLYHAWCPPHWVENELRVARAVLQGGVYTPAPGEEVQIEGRRGLVFERVEGDSMLADVNAHPWRLRGHARVLAELHVQIHRLTVRGLPSLRDMVLHTIETSEHVPDAVRTKTLAALDGLPDGKAVCHGDFHPGNILLTAGGPIVIDWMTANGGNPWADVARTSLLLTVGARNARGLLSPLTQLGMPLYQRTYLAHYRSLVPDPDGLFDRWLPVMAAARLNENIAGEREELLKLAQ